MRSYLLLINSSNSFTKERAQIFTKCVKLKMRDLVVRCPYIERVRIKEIFFKENI